MFDELEDLIVTESAETKEAEACPPNTNEHSAEVRGLHKSQML
jgi:hypothetical protein